MTFIYCVVNDLTAVRQLYCKRTILYARVMTFVSDFPNRIRAALLKYELAANSVIPARLARRCKPILE